MVFAEYLSRYGSESQKVDEGGSRPSADVTAGLFKGHEVTGQIKFAAVSARARRFP
jgi:hypothetical protein